MINPWLILGVVLAFVAGTTGAFFYGKDVGRDDLIAEQAEQAEKTRERDAERATNTEAIATAAGAAVAMALNQNAGVSNESVERIRTVLVPGECRAADPVVVSELRAGQADINAALRGGLRRIAAATGAGDPGDTP